MAEGMCSLALGSSAATAAPDVLRRIFEFLVTTESLLAISSVCRAWRSACDHETVFRALCVAMHWPDLGKRGFIEHYVMTEALRLKPGKMQHTSFGSADNFGTNMLFRPVQKDVFDWASGRAVQRNPNLLLACATAPNYDCYLWDTSSDQLLRTFRLGLGPHRAIATRLTDAGADGADRADGAGGGGGGGAGVNLIAAPVGGGGHMLARMPSGPPGIVRVSAMSVDGNLIFFSDSEAHLHVVDLLSTSPSEITASSQDVAMSSLEIPHAHESAITSVCVHARSKLGASASYDQSLKIWDLTTGALLAGHDFEDRLWCVNVHPDGHLVATGGDDRIVHVMPMGEMGCELVPCGGVALRGHTDAVIVTNFAPAGARQVGRDLFSSGYDARIIQWDYDAGIALRVWEGHTSVVCSLQILPHVVVSGSRDGTTRIWDSFGGDKPISVLEGGGAVKCVLTLSSTRFATAGLLNGIVHIWDFSATGHSGSDVKLADDSINKCVIT